MYSTGAWPFNWTTFVYRVNLCIHLSMSICLSIHSLSICLSVPHSFVMKLFLFDLHMIVVFAFLWLDLDEVLNIEK